MTQPIATNPLAGASGKCSWRRGAVPALLLLLLPAACGTAPETFSPGRLDQDQMARCRAVAQAYVDSDPEYPALRDELQQDPVAIQWFVRYLESEVVQAREGRAEVLSEETVRIDQVRGSKREPVQWDLPGQRRDSRAIGQIVAIGEPAVEVVVNDLATSQQEFLRAIGIEVLTGIGDPAVPALLQLARSGESRQQRVAARALGEVGARGVSLEALRELARSPTWRIRSDAAAQGLAKGGPGARDLLVEMLGDEDAFVRRKAGESLGNYRDPVAGRALVDFLDRCKESGDWNGELAAQKALQSIAAAKGPRTAVAWRQFVEAMVADGGSR